MDTYCYRYPRPSVTTDCVIFGFDGEGLSVLLVERGLEPYKGCWAFPGGFLRMDEDAGTGARRELREETGLEAGTIRQFGTYSAVDRDPRGRVITIAFYALVRKAEVAGGDDAADARWFPVDGVPALAFDHDLILRDALKALKERIFFQPVGFDLLPEAFSMSQLQQLYESVLGVRFDRRNFANKFRKSGLLIRVGSGNVRPVRYSFDAARYSEMKAGRFRLEF